jgi:hypothetical protein
MAQTGFTPIQLYSSSTTGNTPAAADLLNSSGGSELAINIFDGKLFYKDSSGNVQVIGWKVVPVSAGGTGQTSYTDGQLLIGNSTGNTLAKSTLTAGSGISITNGAGAITISATGGTGDVVGPASATDNAIARFDTTTGKLIQNSAVTISDAGAIAGATTITDLDYLDFDTTYATTLGAGQLGWNGNDTLGLGMIGGNVVQHIGEDTFFYVKASSAITKGQLCMFTGAIGASGVITAAPSNSLGSPQYIMGFAAEDIALNAFGLVQSYGTLRNVNTSAYADGDVLYYNSAVTGGTTNVYPTSGFIITVAAVTKGGSAGGGSINIRVTVTQRITASTGISVAQTSSGSVITNSAPDQVVSLTGAGTTSISGTYPSFTITSNDAYVGTVTSVAALTIGTTGTDLSSTVANGTTTPVITLNVPTASAANRGALSAADWTTFNNKGSGSVTSVAASVPSFLSISGSPITTSGTLAITLSGTALPTTSGGTGLTSFTSGGVPYATSTSALTTNTNLYFSGSKLGINDSAVPAALSIRQAGGEYFRATHTSNTGLQANISVDGNGAYYNGSPGLFLQTGGTNRVTVDSSGNVLVGVTSGTYHKFVKPVGTAGAPIVSIGDTGTDYHFFNHCRDINWNAAATGYNLGRVVTTNRSLNAGGTINASGADYAEYMTKADNFVLAKGDVVGIDVNGKLTNLYADAVSFVVKSTDPSYVGGDTWGNEKAIGSRPKDDATQEEKDAFEETLEAARQTVDRIAFAGQVPVNVLGATAGQYIIPVSDNGAIKGEAVTSPTFEQYQTAVGKVIAIETDGRARIIVKVV